MAWFTFTHAHIFSDLSDLLHLPAVSMPHIGNTLCLNKKCANFSFARSNMN